MNRLVCEMCGSANLIKQNGLFVCQNCGCKYSVEEARKIMIQGTVDVSGSTVKMDTSAELKNLYELARRAKNENNSDSAFRYYSQIIVKDPRSWEANFYTTYYQSLNCKLAEIETAANRVNNCLVTVFSLMHESVKDSSALREALSEVAGKLIQMSTDFFNSYRKFYEGLNDSVKGSFARQYLDSSTAARDLLYTAGVKIVKIFGEAYGDISAYLWKLGIQIHTIQLANAKNKQENIDVINAYVNFVRRYDPSYQPPSMSSSSSGSGGGGGCYIATAVYGSYDCPQVWTLRRFRDYALAETWYGRAFIRFYYAVSPALVRTFGRSEWFRKLWRGKLDRMIRKLQQEGYKSTPYSDRDW